MLFKELKVLNKGFVKLIDSMGSDKSIVEAARISTKKQSKTEKDDVRLIRYLMRNNHTSPFEMVEFKFHIKCPIYVARQILRHRTASVNEMSGRYIELPLEFDDSLISNPRRQNFLNNQTSGSLIPLNDMSEKFKKSYEDLLNFSGDLYKSLLGYGVSREQARTVLPLSIYTEFYWKIDLHNLFHFLELRLFNNSQPETTNYAKTISLFVQDIVPISWAAFEDYRLNSIKLYLHEITAILENNFENLGNNELIQLYNNLKTLSCIDIKEAINNLQKIIKNRGLDS